MTSKVMLTSALALLGCGGGMDAGTLEVAIYGEEFIEDGIPADAFVDDWAVDFTVFEVSVGEVTAAVGHDAPALSRTDYQTLDLTQASAGAGQLVVAGEVAGGAYDHLAYRIASVHAEGSATKGAVTKTFAWDLTTPTRYSECEGTAVVDGDTARTQLTIHADHLFYDDLVSSEPNVAFDLIASADDTGDADGIVTRAELESIDITGETRYQVGNATDVTNLWAFIDRQTSTLGHIDGESHCGESERD